MPCLCLQLLVHAGTLLTGGQTFRTAKAKTWVKRSDPNAVHTYDGGRRKIRCSLALTNSFGQSPTVLVLEARDGQHTIALCSNAVGECAGADGERYNTTHAKCCTPLRRFGDGVSKANGNIYNVHVLVIVTNMAVHTGAVVCRLPTALKSRSSTNR